MLGFRVSTMLFCPPPPAPSGSWRKSMDNWPPGQTRRSRERERRNRNRTIEHQASQPEAGGRFPLAFPTSSTRDGSSTAIADHNAHVRNATACGHRDIQAYGDDFTAIGSTASVNARGATTRTWGH